MSAFGGGADVQVPTLVPKPGSPTVTQENLPESEFAAKRALELSPVT
jgi:hypothetical protein